MGTAWVLIVTWKVIYVQTVLQVSASIVPESILQLASVDWREVRWIKVCNRSNQVQFRYNMKCPWLNLDIKYIKKTRQRKEENHKRDNSVFTLFLPCHNDWLPIRVVKHKDVQDLFSNTIHSSSTLPRRSKTDKLTLSDMEYEDYEIGND